MKNKDKIGRGRNVRNELKRVVRIIFVSVKYVLEYFLWGMC